MLELNAAGPPAQPTTASSMLTMLNMTHDRPGLNLLGQPGAAGPLSALHSMADLKHHHHHHPAAFAARHHHHHQPQHSSPTGGPVVVTSESPTGCKPSAAQSSPSSNSSSLPGTPHGIQDILSRPAPTGPPATGPTGLLAGALPRFSLGAAVAAQNMQYLSHKLAAGLATDLSRQQFYWPAMAQNQALWRERIAGQGTLHPSR